MATPDQEPMTGENLAAPQKANWLQNLILAPAPRLKPLQLPPLPRLPFGELLFPILAVIYVTFSVLLRGDGAGPLAGQFIDNDHYQRLYQVHQWLAHGNWYDLRTWQTIDPNGLLLHWTRLPDILIALFTLPFVKPLGMEQALYISSFITPLLLLGLFVALSSAAMRQLNQGIPAPFYAALAVLFMVALMIYSLIPGRVDHHVYSAFAIMFLLYGMAAALRETSGKGGLQRLLLASFAAGICLGATVEALPWVALASVSLGLVWVLQANPRLYQALDHLLTGLVLGTFCALALIKPLPEWGEIFYDQLSLPYVLGFTLMWAWVRTPLIFASLMPWLEQSQPRRLFWLALGAALIAGFLLCLYPAMLNPHWHGGQELLKQITYQYIIETKPIWGSNTAPRQFVTFCILPCFALWVALSRLWHERAKPRASLWLFLSLGLISLLIASLFFQLRFINMLGAFAVLPLAYQLQRLWRPQYQDDKKSLSRRGLAGLLILTTLPVFGTNYWNVLFYPGAYTTTEDKGLCNATYLAAYIASDKSLSPEMRIAALDLNAAKLSFYLPQKFMALGVYHREQDNVTDFIKLIEAPDTKSAEAIIRKNKIDLITLCIPKGAEDFTNDGKTPAKDSWQGFLAAGWALELYHGKIPEWAEKQAIELAPGWLLLRIKPENAAAHKPERDETRLD